MDTAVIVTNSTSTKAPVTFNHRRVPSEQMLQYDCQILKCVTFFGMELWAVVTAVCKHYKSNISPGKEEDVSIFPEVFLNYDLKILQLY